MIDWQQGFAIASICRADLERLGFTQEHIAHLSDEDMEQIAWRMEDRTCDEDYWEDLKDCTNRVLAEKEQLHV